MLFDIKKPPSSSRYHKTLFSLLSSPPKESLDPPLLLGSMYFWSWLIIQLNKSYKHTGKFARTGILTLNGHISETVQNFENLKKIR